MLLLYEMALCAGLKERNFQADRNMPPASPSEFDAKDVIFFVASLLVTGQSLQGSYNTDIGTGTTNFNKNSISYF